MNIKMYDDATIKEESSLKISADGACLVNHDTHWIPVCENTPRNVKMLLINKNHGVTVIGNYTENSHFTHYAGLPKFRK